MGENIAALLRNTWIGFRQNVETFLPRFVSLLALLVIGWLVAFAVRFLARLVLRWIRFDALLERVGLSPALARLGGPAPHALVASFLFWVVWLSFLLAGLDVLGFEAARQLAEDVVRLIPRLAVAIVVVLIGYAVANFLWRAVLLWGANARVHQAKILAAMVRWITLIAAFAMALEQLAIGEKVMHTAFAILMGGVAAGGAIAFGLGARHLARRYLEHQLFDRDEERPHDERGGPHL
jgi:hypothetical protein